MDEPDEPLVKNDRQFFQYMGMAENPRFFGSCADDFAAFVLRLLNFDNEDQIICQRTVISFPMAMRLVNVGIDV